MSAKKRVTIFFPILLFILGLIVILGRQWPGYSELADDDPYLEASAEYLVNDDFSTADQGYSDIGVDAMGNIWIVWQDNREGDYSIYAQHIAWSSERLGGNTPVNDDLSGDEQFDPHVGVSAAGYTKFIWQDYRASGYPTNPDIYAQTVNADGSSGGANQKVNTDFGLAKQRKPNLDMSPAGAAVAVWEDYRNNNWDIYAQWYDNTGSTTGGNRKINDDVTNATQHRPFAAADALGNMLICWYDNRSANDDIWGQIYDVNRNAVSSNFVINDPGALSIQKFPAAAGLPGGGFVVVWTDYRRGPYPADPDIFAQKIGADGQKDGVNFRVNDDSPGIKQTEPQIGSAPTGGFVICWRDERSGDADIFAQRYTPEGLTAGDNFLVNAEDGNVSQSSPAVAISDARMYFVWTDNRTAGLFDIYGRTMIYDYPAISLVPSAVYFSAADGQPNPPTQQVTVYNSGAGVLEWTLTDDANWLSCSPTSGTAPTPVNLQVNISSLTIGEYSATITVQDQNDPTLTGLLTVNLSINYGAPIIAVTPLNLVFSVGLIAASPPPGELTITNEGGLTLNWGSSTDMEWLTITPPMGSGPGVVEVSVITSGLSAGAHEATVYIYDSTSYNTQVEITVSCEVIDDRPAFVLSDSSIYFLAFERQASPPPQQVLIDNDGSGVLDFVIGPGLFSWLTYSPPGGTAPEYVDLGVDTDSLSPGHYYDTLWLIDTLAANSPFALPIWVEVDSVAPEIQLSETAFDFSTMRYAENPDPTEFEIANVGGDQLSWLITNQSVWLTIDPDTGTEAQMINCAVDLVGLSSKEHVDTIVVTDQRAANSPQTISVSLLVDEPDTLFIPELTAAPGASVVLPIELYNIDSIVDISLPLSYSRDYLHLDSATFAGGRIADWLFKSVFVDTIAGTVKFFATAHSINFPGVPLSPGRGPLGFLYLTLAVDAPPGVRLPVDTIELDLSPFSFAESGGASFMPRVSSGGIISQLPGEIALSPTNLAFNIYRGEIAPPSNEFTVNNSGGDSLHWTASTQHTWLTITPTSGSDEQTIICELNPEGLLSGNYLDTVMITDPLAINSPQFVEVALTVTEPDTLFLPTLDAEPEHEVIMPVILHHVDEITAVRLPLAFDPSSLQLDSVSFIGGRVVGWPTTQAEINNSAGTVLIEAVAGETPLAPGNGELAFLFFHVTPTTLPGTDLVIDTTTINAIGLSCSNIDGVNFIPRLIPGLIQVGEPLGIFEQQTTVESQPFALSNYPNPFNAETMIFLQGVPQSSVRLIVYNVLGQPVYDLSGEIKFDDNAGQVIWHGNDHDGRPVGSGIYFAIAYSGENRITQKLLLVR